ncbi:hypothetical protein [Bordetella genomosp. 13]|uniref:hypothetical protein n=1 Tax=Bordetella genomosp. 13 TaxID=463040 RepID=UPI0016433EA2|nr:hypothetical protein [Bordetella genomosp. 13]
MATVGSIAGVAAKALAFAALEKSDTLNRFVGWISGGRVSRETLAQSILHKAVDLGTEYAVANKALGERSAVLLPRIRDAVIDNDMQRMKAAVADLAGEGLSKVMDKDSGNLASRMAKQAIDGAVRQMSSELAGSLVGDHAAEKVVATLVKEHGWAPLENYLHRMLDAKPLGNFLCGQIKAIVQRAIVDNPAYDMRANAEYRLAAGLAAQHLTGQKDYEAPLRQYAPLTMAGVDGARQVAALGGQAVEMAGQARDAAVALAGQARDAAVGLAVQARDTAVDLAGQARDMAVDVATGVAETAVAVRDEVVRQAGEVTAQVSETVHQFVHEDVPLGIDMLQQTLGSEPQALLADQAYARALAEPPVEAAIDADTTPRDLADALLREQVVQAHAPDGHAPVASVVERLADAELAPEHRADLERVQDELSSAQLAPLGTRGNVEVAHTWSGALDRVQAHSHHIESLPEAQDAEVRAALGRVPAAGTDRGGYRVGAGFAAHAKEIDLDLPGASMGYSDAMVESGKALWGAGLSMMGWGGGPDWTESAILKQLYNTCGQKPDVMAEASRYLDPALARDAVAMPSLRAFGDPDTGLLTVNGVRVQVKDAGQPQVSFQVRDEGGFVRVSIDAEWPIAAYGPEGHMREPLGGGEATVKAAASILIHPGVDGAPPRVEHYPLGVSTSISNIVAFDRASGQTA